MRDITIRDIVSVVNGKLLDKISQGKQTEVLDTVINRISIDSRDVTEDSVFVAIPGENVDPHKYIPAVAKVSKAIITELNEEEILAKSDADFIPDDVAYIKVANSLDALQSIGGFVRSRYTKEIIGVTGSVGKTTTREMITHALQSCIPVFHTKGNMNSQIGVPLTLSEICDEESDVAVLEMGISEQGGMDRLTKMVRPTMAVVTMIGVAHIEFMKTQTGIMEEKLRICNRMDSDGVIFLNADDKLLWSQKGKLKVNTIYYGLNPEADYRAENIRFENGYNTYEFVHDNTRITVNLTALGIHNVRNSLVAMAVCDHMGLDLMKAAASFENFNGLRQKIIQSDKGYTVIDDAYNASPDSMKAAIDVLCDLNVTGKKTVVLGDMFELGPDSDKYHSEVGEYIAALKANGREYPDNLFTIGESSKLIAQSASKAAGINIKTFDDKDKLTEELKAVLKPGDAVVLKASNGMKLFDLVDKII